jgi:galactose mutarotase-like enzyme
MYLTLVTQRFAEWGRQLWKQSVLRSGVMTIGVIVVLLLGLAIGWRAHTRGRFASLKADFKRSDRPRALLPPQPGGQDALMLERSAIEGGTVPQFLTATLLPGRGMNVLQITAMLPKRGVVKLLDSPTLEEAARRMTGTGTDTNGGESLATGGAIEAPWAGEIFGTPSGDSLVTSWRGTSVKLPAERRGGTSVATGGLLLSRAGTAVKMNVMPDGGAAEAVYEAGDYEGAWPSRMRIKSTMQLSSRALEMNVVATNTGDTPQPVGIGWRPRFALVSEDRGQVTLRLPSVTKEEVRDRRSGTPSGRLVSVEGTPDDFSSRTGTALKELSLNDTFVHLHQISLDSGPVVELWDAANDFGLRMTMLSPSIKAVHVEAPADRKFVLIEPRFNYDDPFGHEWSKEENTGMVTVEPGKSVQWRIRLEIYGPPAAEDRYR